MNANKQPHHNSDRHGHTGGSDDDEWRRFDLTPQSLADRTPEAFDVHTKEAKSWEETAGHVGGASVADTAEISPVYGPPVPPVVEVGPGDLPKALELPAVAGAEKVPPQDSPPDANH